MADLRLWHFSDIAGGRIKFPLSMRERKSHVRVELRGTIRTGSRLTEAEDGPREAAKNVFQISLRRLMPKAKSRFPKKMRSFRSRKAF